MSVSTRPRTARRPPRPTTRPRPARSRYARPADEDDLDPRQRDTIDEVNETTSSTSRTLRTPRSRTHRASARSSTTTGADALDRRRHGHRRQLRHGERDLHGLVVAPSGQTVSVGYTTADGTASAGPTTRRRRQPGLLPPAGHDEPSPSWSPATRWTRSTRHSSSTSPTRTTRRSPTARASARSPTTTRRRACRSTTSPSPRATAGTVTRHLHRQPRAARGPRCLGRLRDRRTARRLARPTTRPPAATLTFAPGEDDEAITVTVNGDLLDESERDVLREPLEPDERDDRRPARVSARSPTTIRCRRSRSTT